MNNFFNSIDWSSIISDSISGIIAAVISTAITATVGFIIVKKYTSQIIFSRKMKEQGFINTSTNKQSIWEIKRMCEEASEIKIIYVAGSRYLKNNMRYLDKALKRGAKIKFLCCNPKSRFLQDIEHMEMNWSDGKNLIRKQGDNPISSEVQTIINNYQKDGMEIRLYSTEYRMPYVIAHYKDGSVKAWLTMTLPPYKSIKSFVLRGEKKKAQIYDEEINFVDMMEANFDTIWDHCSIPADKFQDDINYTLDEPLYEKWKEFYKIATENMSKTTKNSGILIEVAAQHPLIERMKPNEEFEKRLLLAVQLYKDETTKSKNVYIYCPGSLHMDNGIADKISLSEAGKKFLISQGIPENHIYGDEMNSKYKGNLGVYNSSDECYVASKIFEDMNYKELHCICSSAQMMRKVFSYIRFGYIPNIHTVSCDNMYHNYLDEVFKNIPSLLKENNAFQGDSKIADMMRKARNPNFK